MSGFDPITGLPLPADPELSRDYVALKPGNYKPRKGLAPYKGTNLTEEELQDFKLNPPMGIGDNQSVVYVYPQGTIEVYGKVYCWNRLVKPGIYSRYEKLRFLDDVEVPERRKDNYYYHHATYNKTIRVPNPYVHKRSTEAESILEYNYVSWDDQFNGVDGEGRVYPIPVLNGKITIYPDGTFKTQGIVIRSTDTAKIDPYGYLGDNSEFGTYKTYFDEYTKDDINPLNVYKLISENEDGSITYGAIDENLNLKRSRWIMLPKGLIPVNNGRVAISSSGLIKVDGIVLTGYGHRITANSFYYHELYTKDENGNLVVNQDYIDNTKVYNPIMDTLDEQGFHPIVLKVVDGTEDILTYHPENDRHELHESDEGVTVHFFAMKGWDTFTDRPASDITPFDLYAKFIRKYRETIDELNRGSEITDLGPLYDTSRYPWVSKLGMTINGYYRAPKVRFNPDGIIDNYATLDHTVFWNPTDLELSYLFRYNLKGGKQEGLVGAKYDENDDPVFGERYLINGKDAEMVSEFQIVVENGVTKRVQSNLIPYNVNGQSNTTDEVFGDVIFRYNESDNNRIYVTVRAPVVWKRDDQYYTLKSGDYLYDVSWPDVATNEDGSFKALFDVDGYFTDEPIFISRHSTAPGEWVNGNELDSFDGIRRQEKGLFTAVHRNITAYLTTKEKMWLDNAKPGFFKVNYDKEKANLHMEYHYGISYPDTYNHISVRRFGHDATLLELDYHAEQYYDALPTLLPVGGFAPYQDKRNKRRTTGYRYNRDQEYIQPHEDIRLLLPVSTNSEAYLPKSINRLSYTHYDKQFKLTPAPAMPAPNSTTRNYFELVNAMINGSGAKRIHPLIEVERPYHVLTDGPLILRVKHSAQDLRVFYRTSEELKRITGSVDASNQVDEWSEYLISLKLENKVGFVELWIDDPFNEQYGLNVLRVKLRKDREIKPLVIVEPEIIDTHTDTIIGTGEPFATLTLYPLGEPNNVLGTLKIKESGNWTLKSFGTLTAGQVYVIKQVDEFGNVSSVSFEVVPHVWKEGDLINVNQLMGLPVDQYVYPVNLRNMDNLIEELNLIDSKLTFDIANQTYTIHGILRNKAGDIYPEGTYSFSTAPESYRSRCLSIISIDENQPQAIKDGEYKYRLSNTQAYLAPQDKPLRSAVTTVTMNESIDLATGQFKPTYSERWVFPPNFIQTYRDLVDKLTIVDLDRILPYTNLSLQRVKQILRDNPFKHAGIRVGRYQNKLVIENDIAELVHQTNPQDNKLSIYIYQGGWLLKNGQYNGYRREGYTPQQLLDAMRISRKPDYGNDVMNISGTPIYKTSAITTKEDGLALLKKVDLPDHFSVVTPRGFKGHAFDLSVNGKYKYNGVEIKLPEHVTQPYTLFLYQIKNWNTICPATDYNGEPNVVYLTENYAYTLDINYADKHPKMTPNVERHWTSKGFNPNQFTFGDLSTSTSRVEYHADGITVTVHGRVKVNGRYTRNISQTVTDKSQLQFIELCLDSFIPHRNMNVPEITEGTVRLNNDDSVTTTGVMYYRESNESCQPIGSLQTSSRLLPSLTSVAFSRNEASLEMITTITLDNVDNITKDEIGIVFDYQHGYTPNAATTSPFLSNLSDQDLYQLYTNTYTPNETIAHNRLVLHHGLGRARFNGVYHLRDERDKNYQGIDDTIPLKYFSLKGNQEVIGDYSKNDVSYDYNETTKQLIIQLRKPMALDDELGRNHLPVGVFRQGLNAVKLDEAYKQVDVNEMLRYTFYLAWIKLPSNDVITQYNVFGNHPDNELILLDKPISISYYKEPRGGLTDVIIDYPYY